MKKYLFILSTIFLAVWTWAAIKPLYRDDWLLENCLVFIVVPVLALTVWFFRLSRISYGLITIFLCMHVIGSHYTYAEVPFGYRLQHWLGADRNMYDRLVHFCFGLLLAYPTREVFLRVAKVRGFWGYYLPLDLTLSFSAIYEIIEWLAARNVDPEAGIAFLGSQGDIWDAQKDMGCAGIGALCAMLITAGINWRYDRKFWKDQVESLSVGKDDKPRGEERLEELIKIEKAAEKREQARGKS